MRSAGAMCACGARCGTDIVPGVETSFVSARVGGAGAVVVTPSVRLAEARDGVREVAFVAPSATAFHRRRGCRSVLPTARLSARTGRPNRDRFVATGRRSVAGGGRETRALRGTLPDRRDARAEREAGSAAPGAIERDPLDHAYPCHAGTVAAFLPDSVAARSGPRWAEFVPNRHSRSRRATRLLPLAKRKSVPLWRPLSDG